MGWVFKKDGKYLRYSEWATHTGQHHQSEWVDDLQMATVFHGMPSLRLRQHECLFESTGGCERLEATETRRVTLVPQQPVERGWIVTHPKYGKWFISRRAVIADWKQDHDQAYPDDKGAEPSDDAIETWFAEQTSWIEVANAGVQIERPDMADVERGFMAKMQRHGDHLTAEGETTEVNTEAQ